MRATDRIDEGERSESLLAYQWTAVVYPYMLILIAWGAILLAFALHQNVLFNHDFLLRTSHFSWGVALSIFLVSWQLMTMAMMLPSLLPLLAVMGPVTTKRGGLWARQARFIAGYTLPWTVFALVTFLNDTLVHWIVTRWWWLYLHPWVIEAVVMTIAGCFQLSPFKTRCLEQCCHFFKWCSSPGQADHHPTWYRGMLYGGYCVGSCWALMLVLFGLGMTNPLWMAGATVVIVAEKGMPHRHSLRLLLAGAFFLLALLWCLVSSGSL